MRDPQTSTPLPQSSGGGRGAMIGPWWRFLAEASELLDASLEYQETLANVVRLAVPRVADYAIITLREEDGSLHWGGATHRDPAKVSLVDQLQAYVPPAGTHRHPSADVARGGKTQVVSIVDDDYLRSVAQDATHFALLRQLEPTSYIVLSLEARGRVLGSLLFATARDSGRHYRHRDVALGKELGKRISLAVDNALLYRAAEQTARMRKEMVQVVSHDLKNPVSTIQLAVGFLLDDVVPDDDEHEDERRQLEVIRRSVDRMNRLIHDLLDVAAIEAGHFRIAPTVIAAETLVDEAVEMLRPLAVGKGIELVVDVAPGLPSVNVDRDRMLQVFSNIGGNAIKFTEIGGRITIRAERRASFVEFTVQDTGRGIASTDLPFIFDRYWQAMEKPHGGSGLGLVIAKEILDAHGGDVRIVSELGRGSSFTFTVPAAMDRTDAA
ncbi:MAG TPA: GAF domain-containing sensor histidine kinase [Gemmatimonadaceae bacterium]|nr:GAF domain-containing sensor histidine kinase [Gemmatimonadaceae bacterium]